MPLATAEELSARKYAVLYRGAECEHWREPSDGEHAVQVFLHYVDQNGPLADRRFDSRDSLSSLPAAKLR